MRSKNLVGRALALYQAGGCSGKGPVGVTRVAEPRKQETRLDPAGRFAGRAGPAGRFAGWRVAEHSYFRRIGSKAVGPKVPLEIARPGPPKQHKQWQVSRLMHVA